MSINNKTKSFSRLLTIIIALLVFNYHDAKSQFSVQLSAPTFADSTVTIYQYFGYNQINKQKATLDKKGKSTFILKGKNIQGIYAVRLGNKPEVDFLVGSGKNITINFNQSDIVTVGGNKESEAFELLKKYLTTQNIRKSEIMAKIKNPKISPEASKKEQTSLTMLNDSVLQYFDKVSLNFPTSTLSCYTKMLKGYQAPNQISNPRQALYHQKNNFLEQFELQNSAMVHAPFFPSKLNEYITQIIEPIPDSLIKYCHKLVTSHNLDTTNRRFIVQYLLSFSNSSNIMGIDKLRIFIAEKYLLNGYGGMISENAKQKIKELVAKSKPLIIGNVAPELKLNSFDNDNEIVALHDLKHRYTILFFWEPGCSFCKKSIAELKLIVEKYKDQNVGIFAVNTTTKDKEWRDYVIDNKLFGWTHAYDKTGYSTFRQVYDIAVTPKIFLLDMEKRIIAKDLEAQTFDTVIAHLLKTGSIY